MFSSPGSIVRMEEKSGRVGRGDAMRPSGLRCSPLQLLRTMPTKRRETVALLNPLHPLLRGLASMELPEGGRNERKVFVML